MSYYVEMPPVLTGSQEEQLRTMYRYLYRMAEQVNGALRELHSANQAEGERGGQVQEKQSRLQTELLHNTTLLKRQIAKLERKIQNQLEEKEEGSE